MRPFGSYDRQRYVEIVQDQVLVLDLVLALGLVLALVLALALVLEKAPHASIPSPCPPAASMLAPWHSQPSYRYWCLYQVR